MSQRKAVTKMIATRYARAYRGAKKVILDELCATMCSRRDHARRTLRQALVLKVVKVRKPRPPSFGEAVLAALRICWTRLRAAAHVWVR